MNICSFLTAFRIWFHSGVFAVFIKYVLVQNSLVISLMTSSDTIISVWYAKATVTYGPMYGTSIKNRNNFKKISRWLNIIFNLNFWIVKYFTNSIVKYVEFVVLHFEAIKSNCVNIFTKLMIMFIRIHSIFIVIIFVSVTKPNKLAVFPYFILIYKFTRWYNMNSCSKLNGVFSVAGKIQQCIMVIKKENNIYFFRDILFQYTFLLNFWIIAWKQLNF